jgi:hypothetical protein
MLRILQPIPIIAVSLTVGFPLVARADTITVGGATDYPTMQEGLDAATDGDEVVVFSGTYFGPLNTNLDFHGAGIHLRAITPGGVTIDCQETCRAFLFDDSEDTLSIVDGIVVTHGAGENGGAVLIEDSSPKFTGCAFVSCTAEESGGAVHVATGAAVIISSDFQENYAIAGGAIAAEIGSLKLRDCTFSSNDADETGGAILLDESTATLRSCRFTDNETLYDWHDEPSDGGALHVVGTQVDFEDCSFVGNQARRGGALSLRRPCEVNLSRCAFDSNRSDNLGAAIHMYGCSPTIEECRFERNEPTGGGTVWGEYSSPFMSYCTFWNNKGTYGPDVGHDIELYHTDIGDALIENCTFCGWRMDDARDTGALLRFGDCEPLIERCIISFYNHGPGVTCVGTGEPTITRSIVFGNTGGDEICGDDPENNLSVDPLFCGFWDGDLTLCTNSPGLPWNNSWEVQIGAHYAGCLDCGTPVEGLSWGAIKAMYR